ncbi:hypothetical protein ACLBOM_30340 [Escherichia coli]
MLCKRWWRQSRGCLRRRWGNHGGLPSAVEETVEALNLPVVSSLMGRAFPATHRQALGMLECTAPTKPI